MKSQRVRIFRKRFRQSQPWFSCNLFALSVTLIHLSIFKLFGAAIEPLALEMWFALRGEISSPDKIVIASIDDKVYQALKLPHHKPLPRKLHVELINSLKKLGAKHVFFDLAFIVPSENPDEDRKFADALKEIPSSIGWYKSTSHFVDIKGQPQIREVEFRPLKIFQEAASKLVFMNLVLEDDVVRRFPPGPNEENSITSMAELVKDFRSPGSIIPDENDYINFYGPPGTIRTVSYLDLLEKDINPDDYALNDKIVFVGLKNDLSAGISSSKDSFQTSFRRASMFGVEILATAAGNILDQIWIWRGLETYELICLNVFTFLISLILFSCPPLYSTVCGSFIAISWCVLSYFAFLWCYFLPGLTLILLILPAIVVCSIIHYYLNIRSSLNRVEGAIGIKLV